MPYTFNGCGTRLYGRRDVGEDGSYITTEWITFAYVPLIPIRSRRILPQGNGTNLLVYQSQSYLSRKVPLCWPQVRNVCYITGPILALVLFFSWANISAWVMYDLLHIRPKVVAMQAKSEPALDAAQSAVACGNLLKLEQPTFVKLNLDERIGLLVKRSNFTPAEANVSSKDDIDEDAFAAYALGFLTWNKPMDSVLGDLDKKMVAQINDAGSKLTGNDLRAFNSYTDKWHTLYVNALDMGRSDGRTSPCPY